MPKVLGSDAVLSTPGAGPSLPPATFSNPPSSSTSYNALNKELQETNSSLFQTLDVLGVEQEKNRQLKRTVEGLRASIVVGATARGVGNSAGAGSSNATETRLRSERDLLRIKVEQLKREIRLKDLTAQNLQTSRQISKDRHDMVRFLDLFRWLSHRSLTLPDNAARSTSAPSIFRSGGVQLQYECSRAAENGQGQRQTGHARPYSI